MRTPIAFFVSYAHADRRPAGTFLRLLTEQLAPSKRYAYTLWRDTEILAGERWYAEIQQALPACQLGLLLVSPAFLASEYITQQELPQFLGDGAKPIIPVMLKLVDLQRHDLKGLKDHQIFSLDKAKTFDNRIRAVSPGAWRYLGWRYFDPHANRLRILPAEHFGPLLEG